jgi:transcriptional regulator with XRE-family HTH domain
MKESLPDVLKNLRARSGMSLQQVVAAFELEQMDLTKSAICNWEAGSRRPTQQNLWMLAGVYQCADSERLALMDLLFKCPPSRRSAAQN